MDKKEIKKVNLRLGNLNFRRTQDDNYEIVKWITRENEQEKEYCIVVASFRIDSADSINLEWCGRRPLDLDADEYADFMQCVRFGYDFLEKYLTYEE